ncbi:MULTISPECIES: ATP-binding protein [unclassified Bifidobacterium]|uniref:ATP-binding protein n=1 Tax=unclassified Bifidobacterium TaxID=2608897 RepID=UPI00112B72E4|nr:MULTISPECIES: ATP-binding protein [unclassified Bifidobacterium]TPF77943.1 transcriptional regulator [Bifidobacterium sp. UTCIF-1]TPF80164.1 transcriptional regulator [Bifidobacterium sp. UTCIF-24]TPF82970.1 transcriptional regulator [Bifidobacterium sp. UTCIF-3]TPF83877.1 transcriptional regulator [Bifidobacterium sp. UTCIF-36]TPF90653.1 transcriptional regulator [Bifidobacterium sp. UTBIF-56]
MENLTLLVNELVELPAETEWLEFKHNKYTPEMIGEDISALANGAALAGHPFAYLIWGIDDATHAILGTKNEWHAMRVKQQEIENWVRTQLSGNTELDFLRVQIDEQRHVLILKIGSAVNRPVSFDKTEYIRVGSYTKKLRDVPSKQTALWDRLRASRFENGIAKNNLTAEDILTILNAQSYFDHLKRPYPSTSQSIVDYFEEEGIVIKQDDGRYSVSNMGALLFAKNLSDFSQLSRKTVRIIRYDSDNRIGSSKEEEYTSGYAVDFDGLIKLINAMTPSRETIEQSLREEHGNYPEQAIRETVANALIHQDFTVTGAGPMIEIFNHRMEITNPGTLMVDRMRIIDAPPRSRNEDIAALMRRMKICEERGTGWDKIAMSCELMELPSPKIRGYDTGTRVTLYSERPFARISMEDREWACYMHACLRYINEDTTSTYMTNSSLRQRFGLGQQSQPAISKLIKRTMEMKLIKPLDPNTAPRYMKYIPIWA